MAKGRSVVIDGAAATIAWQTAAALVSQLPTSCREIQFQNRHATANLYIVTTRSDDSVPGITAADYLKALKILPGGSETIRAVENSIRPDSLYVSANTNESATTCDFAVLTTGK